MVTGDRGLFSASAAPPAASTPASGALAGKAALQPPVAYLPCRLDEDGNLADVLMVELVDGRIALLGYTALDRFLAACGDAHPWVLWQTAELDGLRDVKAYDVAYLDVPLPAHLRLQSSDEAGS
jgi:hypothetical protein